MAIIGVTFTVGVNFSGACGQAWVQLQGKIVTPRYRRVNSGMQGVFSCAHACSCESVGHHASDHLVHEGF